MIKYRSEFEKQFHRNFPEMRYENSQYVYYSKHSYTPDFENKTKYLFEIKGRFRTSEEARKYLNIRASLKDKEIIFIFQNPNTKMPRAKKRKDGTFFTVSEWAAKHNFKWATIKTIKKEWLYDRRKTKPRK